MADGKRNFQQGVVRGTIIGCTEPSYNEKTGEQTPWRVKIAADFGYGVHEYEFDWCPKFGSFDPEHLDRADIIAFSTGSNIENGTSLLILKDTRANLKQIAVDQAAKELKPEEAVFKGAGKKITDEDAMARRSYSPPKFMPDPNEVARTARWAYSRIHPGKTAYLTTNRGNGVYVDEREEVKGVTARFGKSSMRLADSFNVNAGSMTTSFEYWQANWGGWQPPMLSKFIPSSINFPIPAMIPLPPAEFMFTLGMIGAAFA
jgi:hypothetical protein